jgi:hypothetical protein
MAAFPAVFLSATRLATLNQRILQRSQPTYAAFLKLEQDALAQLDRQPHVPALWYIPGYYVDARGHREGKLVLEEDANSAYALALYFRMSDDERFARAAARLIDGWAGLTQFRTEDDSTLSFSYHFPALILAADLIKDWAGWPPPQQQAFKQFVQDKAVPMNCMARANNWGNWGLVLVMAAASYLQSTTLFDRGLARWKEFIETQMADDGHLPHEVGRNDGVGERGIWYSHFSIMPQTIAAEIARVNGVDLYDYRSPSGRTLRMAFERLVPWALDPATFPYYTGDPAKGPLSSEYISYYELLNMHWPNAEAAAHLAKLRPLTATHCTPHLTFTHGDLLHDDGR